MIGTFRKADTTDWKQQLSSKYLFSLSLYDVRLDKTFLWLGASLLKMRLNKLPCIDPVTNETGHYTFCGTHVELNSTWMQTTPTWKYGL